MKQYFELGLCIAALTGIGAVLLQDWKVVYQFSGIIGFLAIVCAFFFFTLHRMGQKGNMSVAKRKKQSAIALFAFGLPNIIVAVLSFLMK